MRAKLFANSMQCGHIARDSIHLTRRNQKSALADTGPEGKVARAVLESYEDQNRSITADPIVPIRPLVRGLTESLRGMPTLVTDDKGRINGASLYKGCKVRVMGIPERRFTIIDIYWDYDEVRVREKGTNVEYVFPWDCLDFAEE